MKKKNYLLSLLASLIFAVCILLTASAWADLRVNVMPSGITDPDNSWDSEPYTWPGNTLELWGNVQYDGTGTLTYTWDFGAGQGTVSGTVTSRYNISVTHAYPNGSFIATLTVTDGTETDTDTVFIDVVPQTLEVETNLAIQKALKYQYLTRVSTTVNGQQAYYWNGKGNSVTDAALAVLAFENHGHLATNDTDEDIYAETVKGGLNFIFSYGVCTNASSTEPDSDINNNQQKCYLYSYNLYDIGITTMAVAGSASPNEVVGPEGSAAISGKTYKELLEDLVDYIAWAQNDSGSGYGGWRYTPNRSDADNSVTQWPVLALGEAAKQPWNINAPPFVKTRMASWLDGSSQRSDGGFGYTYANNYPNVAKTGAGIAGLAYAGLTDISWNGGTKLSKAIDYLNTYWNTNQGGWLNHYNIGYHYAMYAVKKGMEFADQPLVGTHDWLGEYEQWYVDHQYANGSWPNGYWINDSETNTAFGLLVLAPIDICKPHAVSGGAQEAMEGAVVVLDGSDSFMEHCTAEHDIVKYEWDCDYDGVNFTVDSTGPVAQCTYTITNGTDTQLFTAALRVTDDQDKVDTDTATITITNGNVAPVADTGGPYSGGVGTDITLDGSGSYDVNACDSALGPPCLDDFIASYQWDLDGDGLFGSEDNPPEPEGETVTVNFGNFIGTKTVGLKVTDSFGKSAEQSTELTTVALSDLYPVSYELVSKTYNRRTRMWTVTWRMNIINDGQAAASEVSAEWTPGSIPVGVTAIDPTVSWTDPDNVIEAGEIQISGDADPTFSYTYSRYINPPDLTQITWDISFTDSLGQRHVVRGIRQ